MSVAYVSSTIVNAGFGSTLTSGALTTVVGNGITVTCAYTGGTFSSISDSKSNSLTQAANSPRNDGNGSPGQSQSLYFCTLTAAGSGHTVTVTTSGSQMQVGMLQVSGQGTPTLASSAANSGTGSFSCGTLTSVPSGSIIVAAMAVDDFRSSGSQTYTFTAPSGFTLAASATGTPLPGVFAYEITSTTGTVTPAFGVSPTNNGTGMAMAWPSGTVVYSLAAAAGSYTMYGLAATLVAGTSSASFVLLANSGTYDYVGAPSSSYFSLSATAGSYAMTGGSVTFTTTASGQYTLTASAGMYAMTGEAATLTGYVNPNPSMFASAGNYVYAGQSVLLTIPIAPTAAGGPGHIYASYATGTIYTRIS